MVRWPVGLLGPGRGHAGLLPLPQPGVPAVRHIQLPVVHVVRRAVCVHSGQRDVHGLQRIPIVHADLDYWDSEYVWRGKFCILFV